MDPQERIAALQQALATLNAAIAQLNSSLAAATDPGDIQNLTSLLADSQAERQNVQFQVTNLQMAAAGVGEIAPAAAATVRALAAELNNMILRQATIAGVLDFGNAVLAKVSALRQAAT
jgi:hypothetical protein